MPKTDKKRGKAKSNSTPNSDATIRKSRKASLETDRTRTQSTDSENDIGSQSPLLDRSRSTKSSDTISDRRVATIQPDETITLAGASTSSPASGASAAAATEEELDTDFGEGAVGGCDPNAEPEPEAATSAVDAVNAAITVNTKSEDSGCPSSDCEQASASSKDMLLSKAQKPSTTNAAERIWADFNMDANAISVDMGDGDTDTTTTTTTPRTEVTTTESPTKPLKGASKSLGAIPKSTFGRNANNRSTAGEIVHSNPLATEKSPSQTSSSNSVNVSSSNSLSSLNRNELHILHQTEDGFVLQTAPPNNPYMIAHRGGLPPLLPTFNRTENVFSVPRKSYMTSHSRRPGAKLSSTRRHRYQNRNSSIETTISGEDPWHSAGAVGGSNCGVGGSGSGGAGPSTSLDGPSGSGGSMAVDSGWDVVDLKLTDRFHSLFFQDPPNPISRAQVSRIIGEYWSQFNHFSLPVETQPPQPKRYYRFPWQCFNKQFKISMDRLQLMALFDRDKSSFQSVLAVVVATICSILGAWVLQLGFYRDLLAFIFCFVMAGSQYSLLKSVQPDASSSTHGDDARYSRPIYFCICSGILIVSHHLAQPLAAGLSNETISIFGWPYTTVEFFHNIRDFMVVLMLLFPIFFTLGLFAQINTFLMYAMEQVDMHIFGGNAVCSLSSGFLSILRSVLACCLLYGFAFGGLAEPRGTQHVLFSCFCAVLVAVSYHLSRTASDFTYLWMIVQSSFAIYHDDDVLLRRKLGLNPRPDVPEETIADSPENGEPEAETQPETLPDGQPDAQPETLPDTQPEAQPAEPEPEAEAQPEKDGEIKEAIITVAIEDDQQLNDDKTISAIDAVEAGDLQATVTPDPAAIECLDPLPGKLKKTVYRRLKNDLLVCTVIGVIVMSLHCSTVFTALQPELNPILQYFVIVLGFCIHYVMPQMRKHFPWLCFTQPLLKQNEFGMFEASKAAKIMWFERAYVVLTFLEKNILLPLVFISALTSDSMDIVRKFGLALGAGIIVLCGLKSEFYLILEQKKILFNLSSFEFILFHFSTFYPILPHFILVTIVLSGFLSFYRDFFHLIRVSFILSGFEFNLISDFDRFDLNSSHFYPNSTYVILILSILSNPTPF